MESVRIVPEMPHTGPKSITKFSNEKNFSPKFYLKLTSRIPKNYKQYLIKLSGMSQERPAKVPALLYSPIVKNFFPPEFIIFSRNIFHNFETLRRSLSTR